MCYFIATLQRWNLRAEIPFCIVWFCTCCQCILKADKQQSVASFHQNISVSAVCCCFRVNTFEAMFIWSTFKQPAANMQPGGIDSRRCNNLVLNSGPHSDSPPAWVNVITACVLVAVHTQSCMRHVCEDRYLPKAEQKHSIFLFALYRIIDLICLFFHQPPLIFLSLFQHLSRCKGGLRHWVLQPASWASQELR